MPKTRLEIALIAALVYGAVSVSARAQGPPAIPAPAPVLSRFGGALVVGVHGAPEPGVGYPLAEWSSLFRHGRGTIVGLLTKSAIGLGLGHRFTDYESSAGEIVSFTIGPSYMLPYDGNGLSSGRAGAFVVVAFHPKPKNERGEK